MPAYAQAVMTQAAELFYDGTVVLNDANTTFGRGDIGGEGSALLWGMVAFVDTLCTTT